MAIFGNEKKEGEYKSTVEHHQTYKNGVLTEEEFIVVFKIWGDDQKEYRPYKFVSLKKEQLLDLEKTLKAFNTSLLTKKPD